MEKNTIYQGRFKGLDEGVIYTVRIEFDKDSTVESQNIVSIGEPGDDILFKGNDTLEITSEVNDTFDHILQSSATIRLLVKDDHPEFYVSDYRKVMVTIYGKPYVEGARYDNPNMDEDDDVIVADEDFGKVLFTGYIEPLSYQQGYDQEWDAVELNCMDVLSSLKYRNYGGANTASQYEGAVKRADLRTMEDILHEALYTKMTDMLPEGCIGGRRGKIFYVNNVKAIESSNMSIFHDILLRDELFFGDNFDDVKNYEDVLKEILTFLNMRIVMHDGIFLIYSFEEIKNNSEGGITFTGISPISPIFTPGQSPRHDQFQIDAPTMSSLLSFENNISRDEVFNRIKIKADITEMEPDIIEDPLDDDLTNSDYDPELYAKEYIMWRGANNMWGTAFKDFLMNKIVKEGSTLLSIYFRILKNTGWTNLNVTKSESGTQFEDLNEHFKTNKAAVLAFGYNDNFKEMSRYFVLRPNDTRHSIGAVFTGQSHMAIPAATDEQKNYIVISGSVVHTPSLLAQQSMWRKTDNPLKDPIEWDYLGAPNRQKALRYMTMYPYLSVLGDLYEIDSEEVFWYTMDFHSGGTPTETNGMVCPKSYLYKQTFEYAGPKQACMQCRLTFILDDGTRLYLHNTLENRNYSWVNTSDSFYVFVSIPDDENTIGEEFEFINENNKRYAFDDKGLVIPVPEEGVTGTLEFEIIRCTNMLSIQGNSIWSYAEAMMVKDFNVKIKADRQAADDFTNKKDVVYYSDTNDTFFNEKSIEFDLHSGLTAEDIQQMGLKESDEIMASVPLKYNDEGELEEITHLYHSNTGKWIKPEKNYIDAAYREHSKPLVEMEISVKEGINADGGTTGDYVLYDNFHKWDFADLVGCKMADKVFWPFSVSHNLQQCTAEIKMKEINHTEDDPQTNVGMYAVDKK